MSDDISDARSSVERRAQIEAMLAKYPQVSEEELGEILHWFRREASAYDVGLVASNSDIYDAYLQFRAKHLDRFSVSDVLVLSTILLLVIAGIAFAVVFYV